MTSDLGVHSPLVDLFVRGDVPPDVRLLAASGHIAPRAIEQVALVALMTFDADADVARTARETLAALPVEGIGQLLGRGDTPVGLKAWLAAQGFVPAGASDGDADLPPFEVGEIVSEDGPTVAVSTGLDTGLPIDEDGKVARLSSLPVPVRIKMAMLGSREQRAILIRDSNRVVSTAVLSSPKLSETEVENFARMTNVSADVLRIVGSNRSWVRHYAVVAALVRNPRTPPAISLGLVPRLLEREIKGIAVDRNVPEALRIAARKSLQAKEARRQ